MAKKKASAQDKADAFLAGLGTAGGAIGSPGLVTFGAGDTQRQLMTGNMDNNWAAKEQQMVEDAAMPQNLDASYLKLNLLYFCGHDLFLPKSQQWLRFF